MCTLKRNLAAKHSNQFVGSEIGVFFSWHVVIEETEHEGGMNL